MNYSNKNAFGSTMKLDLYTDSSYDYEAAMD